MTGPGPIARALGPTRDPLARSLHRLVAGCGDEPNLALADLARAAHRAEVAVLAASLLPALAPHLGDILDRQRRFDALLELALAEVAPVLVAGPPVALAKGTATAAWCYAVSAERQRKDLDLLVGDALPEVRSRLLARGWRDHLDPRASRDVTTARAWPMAKELGRATIGLDLHRGLVHGTWCRPDVAAMIAAAVPGRTVLPVTSAVDTLVHTAVHLTGSGYHEPLKGWVDLLRLAPLVSPDMLAARAAHHHARTATWACLGVVGRWFGDQPGLAAIIAAHRAELGTPRHGRLIDALLAGEHATPERRPMPRGLAYRFWRLAARD